MYSMEKCKVCGISDKVTRKENDAQVVGWPDSTFDGVNNKHTGGKPRGTVPHSPAMQSNIKEETLSIRRDWRNNGNEIGENIAVIKRKSRHGLYFCWTHYQ